MYVQEVSIGKKKKYSEEQKKKNKELLDSKYKENSKLIKGVIKNLECPGGSIAFTYREYPQEPARIYKFMDNEECEIPLGVARHINRIKYIRKKYKTQAGGEIMKKDANGQWKFADDKPIDRYQFTSMEFM